MGATVSNVRVSTYETIVRHRAQQMPSRLRPWVVERGLNSEEHNWEKLGTADAAIKAGRAVPTPDVDTGWSRRQSVPVTYDVGDSTEQEDIVQMIVDPNSNIARAQGYAMRRAFDDEIISAATGVATDVPGGATVFPNSQKVTNDDVPDSYVGAMSFDLITKVTETFLTNDIDPDEEKVFVIGPVQARKLLQLTEASSGDYNALRPLQSAGIVRNWMGYTWVVSTRLNHPTAPGVDVDCFAMTRRALGLMVDRDITVRIAEDPSVSFMWRIYCFATFGAVRVEDEHIVWAQVADTI